jgi:hypothetical protein
VKREEQPDNPTPEANSEANKTGATNFFPLQLTIPFFMALCSP